MSNFSNKMRSCIFNRLGPAHHLTYDKMRDAGSATGAEAQYLIERVCSEQFGLQN